MAAQRIKSLLVAVFSLGIFLFSTTSFAQNHGENAVGGHEATDEKLDPAKIIMDHIKDAHEFHFFSVGDFHATVPLPVILYSPTKGFSTFSSSKFDHGHTIYNGYISKEGVIEAADGSAVYDFSITKNVVQMILALLVLVLLMTGIAKNYKAGIGVTTAPKGWQNAIEPVITFVRDEVARPNLGKKAGKYLPYLLTIF
ncbi:MAG: F0F1 ATP synthase subunit A, partial [Gloeobacteraceae cyanobacterium ES-bin-316]|nr:F0F1 ATP synthase subunit A [Ferruginibacter sp.]